MDKKEIRREMKRRSLGLTPQERRIHSERIFGQVEQLAEFAGARTVALFASLPDEPDTAALLARWHGRKRVLVPRVEGDVMHFCDYHPEQMEPGAFGIAEPQDAQPADPAEIDFILVPGTAFTVSCARMGRGRGYYDKYMSQREFRAFKAGVCYPHQIVGELPIEPHDVLVDVVCTGE